MAPKKNKVSLADFLADEKTGKVDWADDFDDLPAAPLTRPDRGIPRRGDDWLSSMPDRADRDRALSATRGGPGPGAGGSIGFDRGSFPPREELPLPTNPPYTAFVGNLAFDLTDGDVEEFFAPNKMTSVRLVSGHDGRPKGFGYVEFETLDGLKDGLARSGGQMTGRTVRVSVAESRDAKGSGFGSSVAEEASQWRRAGPLPPTEAPARRSNDRPGFGNRFDSSPSGGFDQMEVGAGGRSGFGSRFAPSAPREGREPREPRVAEPLEPSVGDTATDWRTGKPTTEPAHRRPAASPAGEGARSSFRKPDSTETDERYASQERLGFGSKFVPTPPESPSASKRPGFGFDRKSTTGQPQGAAAPGPNEGAETWRSASSRRTSEQGASSPSEPAQRKKLDLKPRSTPVADASAAPQAAETPSASGKANPFGTARPIDAAEREKAIEAKMAQREKERKEEDKRRKEKQKSDREKAGGAPTEPRSQRSKSRSASTSEKASAATAGTTNDTAPAATGDDDATAKPVEVEAVKNSGGAPSKQPTPTGAWGGGRKPSGALASPSLSAAGVVAGAPEGANGSAAEANGAAESAVASPDTEGAGVEEAIKGVEATSIQS